MALEKVLWLIHKEKAKICSTSKEEIPDSLNRHGTITSMESNTNTEEYCLLQYKGETMNAELPES